MMSKKQQNEMINDLYEAITSIKNEEDCQNFLEDLCSYKEIEQMAQRVRAAKLLMEGKTYNQIIEEIDISSTTLARVNKCIQYGSGYTTVLKVNKEE